MDGLKASLLSHEHRKLAKGKAKNRCLNRIPNRSNTSITGAALLRPVPKDAKLIDLLSTV